MRARSSASRRGPNSPSQRQLKVGEELRHVVSQALMRGEIHDPQLRETSLTISEVRVSPDLRHARLFVSQLGCDDLPAETSKALERAASFLGRIAAKELSMKYAPKLHFEADTTFRDVARLERMLDEALPERRRGN